MAVNPRDYIDDPQSYARATMAYNAQQAAKPGKSRTRRELYTILDGDVPAKTDVTTATVPTVDYGSIMQAYQNSIAQQQARAEEAARLKQQAAQNAYDKNIAALTSAYDERGNLLKGNLDETLTGLQRDYDYSAGQVNDSAARAMQEAYVNRMKTERDLPQQLAALGLSGGASESTLAGVKNEYGNARNNIDVGRGESLASLLNTLNGNQSAAQQAYNAQLANDSTAKTQQQIALEQALANGVSDILTSKYDTLAALDSDYANQMLALQQAQAEQNAKIAAAKYKAENDPEKITVEQQMLALGKKPGRMLGNKWVSEEEMAYEFRKAGYSDEDIARELNRNRDKFTVWK